ncbi:hypothetical protein AVEN_35994-1 [Araneus ventricosus]|uniref:Uncharacterized protein n=1 Tax=Araneus ventricosus TaxID=182803 RepID=A0A4Y2R2C1_ARAVE|nr:hypothetical protein AVEN_35994-1 [Araneus ventricosus]
MNGLSIAPNFFSDDPPVIVSGLFASRSLDGDHTTEYAESADRGGLVTWSRFLAEGFQVRNPIPLQICLLLATPYTLSKRPPVGVVRELQGRGASSGVVIAI